MIKKIVKTTSTVVIFVFIISVLFQACSLQPLAWTPSIKPELKGILSENDLLSSAQKMELNGWQGPEDIAIDKEGNIYCGVHEKENFDNGLILKITPDGQRSTFCNTGSWVAGLHFDKAGNLIACDMERGLISINPNGEITVLAEKDEASNPFLIPNDIDIATNGLIYFSNTSSKMNFTLKNTRKIILEMKPDGGLYEFNPATKEVKTLIDSSYFGNGVAVSQNDDFVLMVDLAKYRVLKYHLKGIKKGEIETFIENLPGFPNGISRRTDGSFWLGFSTKRDDTLDKIHDKPTLKKLVFGLPKWMQPQQIPYGMVMHLSENGEILNVLYDTKGKAVSEASSIEEHEGYIYIGGDLTNHIMKYKLDNL